LEALQRELETLAAQHRAACLVIEQRQRAVEAERADDTAPKPVAEGSDVLDRPPRWARVQVSEAAVKAAQRGVTWVEEEIARRKRLITAVTENDEQLRAYERACGAVERLDQEMSGIATAAMLEITARLDEHRKLETSEASLYERLPVGVRDAVARPAAVWSALRPTEAVVDRLPHALRGVQGGSK
jgi:hypothetical protein